MDAPDLHLFMGMRGEIAWADYGHYMALTRVHKWKREISEYVGPSDLMFTHKDYPEPRTLADAWAIQSALNALNET